MYNNHELQDKDLQLAAANQVVELDDNELDNVNGGLVVGYAARIQAALDGKRGWDLIAATGLGVVAGGLTGGAWGASLSNPKA